MSTHQPETSKNVVIIGGGPAGLMAAEIVAQAGHTVTLYERKPTVGRKFLMAGRGGLNITHSEPFPQFVTRYGEAASWLTPALNAFTPDDLRAWCHALGQETFVGSSGRVFPTALKASPLLRAWIARLTALGVTIKLQQDWQGFTADGGLLINNNPVHADAVVLALGGASWPKLGSDGSWADWLRAKGITVTPFAPANCGFLVTWSEMFARKFAGTPIKPVVLHVDGASVQGEMMVTTSGIEGGAVYALSSRIRQLTQRHGHATLQLDLRPGVAVDELARRLASGRGSQSFSTYLRKAGGLSPIAASLLHEVTTPDQRRTLPPAALARLIKAVPLQTQGTTGLERAISSAGGIARDELTDDFMLKKLPGVYAVGEMLDWEAPTGGYLLQASIATAVTAARALCRALAQENG